MSAKPLNTHSPSSSIGELGLSFGLRSTSVGTLVSARRKRLSRLRAQQSLWGMGCIPILTFVGIVEEKLLYTQQSLRSYTLKNFSTEKECFIYILSIVKVYIKFRKIVRCLILLMFLFPIS